LYKENKYLKASADPAAYLGKRSEAVNNLSIGINDLFEKTYTHLTGKDVGMPSSTAQELALAQAAAA
jgi:hypothetical protein